MQSLRCAAAVAFLLTLSVAGVQAADAPKPADPAAIDGPTISVVTASEAEVSEQILVTGSLVPREEVLVTPAIEGQAISEILVEVGDHVDKGQVMARLNRDMFDVQMAQFKAQLAQSDAAKAQADAQVAQAKANQLQASRALTRTLALKGKGFATAAKLDQDQSAASVTDAQLESAMKSIDVALANTKAIEAQRDQVVLNISRADVRAQSAGIVSQRNVRLGQIGSMTGLPMFRIIADADIELDADVPDISMPRIRKGMVVAVLPAGMTDSVAGTVRLIAPEIDKATRLGHVRIALAHDDRLAIGASARGSIEVGRSKGVTLPLSAVSYDATGAYVQIVKDNIVRTQRVAVGLRGSKSAEITSGLVVGDQVIARAGTFVRDGDRVRPVSLPIQEVSQ